MTNTSNHSSKDSRPTFGNSDILDLPTSPNTSKRTILTLFYGIVAILIGLSFHKIYYDGGFLIHLLTTPDIIIDLGYVLMLLPLFLLPLGTLLLGLKKKIGWILINLLCMNAVIGWIYSLQFEFQEPLDQGGAALGDLSLFDFSTPWYIHLIYALGYGGVLVGMSLRVIRKQFRIDQQLWLGIMGAGILYTCVQIVFL